MATNKIKWCCRKKEGIRLIEPNENLSERYIEESNLTLDALEKIDNKWNLIMGYYACYNALYSVLMKAGIKSEIHDCSIALMRIIPQFSKEDIKFLEKLKEDRIGAQYYLKSKILEDKEKVKDFILKCKQVKEEIDVGMLRKSISKYTEGDKN